MKPDSVSAETLNRLGVALYRQGKLNDALPHYYEAIRIKPGLAEAHSNLGIILSSQNRIEEGIGQFRAALKLDPRNPEILYNLGLTLARLGKNEEAVMLYKAALEIEPSYADARRELGNALFVRGYYREAVEQYEISLKIKPDSAKTHNNLGLALKCSIVKRNRLSIFMKRCESTRVASKLNRIWRMLPIGDNWACRYRTVLGPPLQSYLVLYWDRSGSERTKPERRSPNKIRSKRTKLNLQKEGYTPWRAPEIAEKVIAENNRNMLNSPHQFRCKGTLQYVSFLLKTYTIDKGTLYEDYAANRIPLFFFAQLALYGLAQNTIITTHAGPPLPMIGAQASTQAIDFTYAVAADGSGGFYASSETQNRIYRVAADGSLSLAAGVGSDGYSGDGGPAAAARLKHPNGVAVDSDGNL